MPGFHRGIGEATVSILAHLARWALQKRQHELRRYYGFQSSPTSQGGRYAVMSTPSNLEGCFNPRPPRKVGATQLAASWDEIVGVSILAHLARWALPVDTVMA